MAGRVSLDRRQVAELCAEVRRLYTADPYPWVLGYSGGKDSTAALQLVWMALAELPAEYREKPVHVIATDTLVEQPLVAAWVQQSLGRMAAAAAEQGMPVQTHRLTPDLEQSFWVCLIGRGYAAPRPGYRWCTDRLKIGPSNRFIRAVTSQHGRSVLVLGTRKAESRARRAVMERYARRGRGMLAPNGRLRGSVVFTPLQDWSVDDVWWFLMQYDCPWGQSNKALLSLYRSASDDGECPLVIDRSTPSCGNSRFGCWACTYVSRDRSMEALVGEHPGEYEWMLPLLELRNELAVRGENGRIADHHLRDWRRASGRVVPWRKDPSRPTPGPYTREARHHWLRRVLEVQEAVRELAPPEYRDICVIQDGELRAIRRIWVCEKYEWEDALPVIEL